MTANRQKRQHYVPEFLLNNFCDERGQLWVGNREQKKIYKGAPREVFAMGHLYTKVDPVSGSRSWEYENQLQTVENYAAPIVKKIIREARKGRGSGLSSEQTDIVKRFILGLARRTPESQERVSSNKPFAAIFYEVVVEAAANHGCAIPEKDSFYQNPCIEQFMKRTESNTNARFAAGDHPHEQSEEDKFCRGTGLCVIYIPEGGLVIGSHGVAIVSWTLDSKQVYLPIAPDVAIAPNPWPDTELLEVIPRTSDRKNLITEINRAYVESSSIIAGQSEELISSLMQS